VIRDRSPNDETIARPVRLLLDPPELDRYQSELIGMGVRDVINDARRTFAETVSGVTSRGYAYGVGGLPWDVCVRLYGLVRECRPSTVVETGVCNGVSTTVILAALNRNGAGTLHSIDLPEFTETAYPPGAFWSGKRGAAVPRGKAPGWLVPAGLRSRWELIIGRSQDVLASLLQRLGSIDCFFHDSEHSYECMMFEYEVAWRHLRSGGVLVSDDVGWNEAFQDFARRQGRPVFRLTTGMAGIIR
jgi:predicted O-methyltransferase YrrM